jgi:type II secretory pathway component GspD/PulD (secretin)
MRLVVLLLVLSVGAVYAASDLSDHKITVTAQDADIALIVGNMFKQAGVSYTLADDVRGTVTAQLDDIPLDVALKAILSPKGLTFRKQGDVYVVSKKEVPKPAVFEIDNSPKLPEPDPKPAIDQVAIEKIPLNFMDARELRDLIMGNGSRTFDTAGNRGISSGINNGNITTPGSPGYSPFGYQQRYGPGSGGYGSSGLSFQPASSGFGISRQWSGSNPSSSYLPYAPVR